MSQEGIIEDRLHYVEAVNLVVICLICYFELCQQEVQCAVQEQCFFSLNLGLSPDLIVRAIGFDNGWLSSQNRQDCRWDASRATQNCAVVLREYPLQRLFEHLHGDMLVRFRDKKLFDEESEGLGSDRDRATVLSLEEHLKEAVAKEGYVLVDEELALVGWITWQFSPLDQSLKRLTVLLDRKPNADKNQIFVVFKGCCITSSLLIVRRCGYLLALSNRVASAIYSFLAVISDSIV